MLDAMKQLLENNVMNEETRDSIMEAWDNHLAEAREELRVELREEFAQRYEHDKSVMVEALDLMVQEGLKAEIMEFKAEREAMAADRVKYHNNLSESVAQFNKFMITKLSEEISELRKDRAKVEEGLKALQLLVTQQLSEEISEFATDKKDLAETKVRLVTEAREKLETLKRRFVAESATKTEKYIKTQLSTELNSLREDIETAKKNNFGRKVTEAFMNECMSLFMDENVIVRGLKNEINGMKQLVSEAKAETQQFKQLLENKDKKINRLSESVKRQKIMDELVGNLKDEKRSFMVELLEGVATRDLEKTFDKYLPAVLNGSVQKESKKTLNESFTEVTGDKTAKVVEKSQEFDELQEFKKLAGL